MSTTLDVYLLTTPGAPLQRGDLPWPTPAPGQALVEVLGCGVCHTDLGYADGSVRPNHPLPLVLGHEVVGRVVEAGEGAADLVGQQVLVPAVLPCGVCAFCRAGRGNACPQQQMPGNDIHGGFGSHLLVPAAPLISLEGAPDWLDVRALAVVADAVSTAWQAVARADVAEGDVVFVLGAGGGVGGYATQIAASRGAHVVACDVDAGRLAAVAGYGAEETIATAGLDARELRRQAHALAKRWGVPSLRWRILECSGHPLGQQHAFTLLARAATMVQVGYTPAKVELRLSNMMAFDATLHGTWGCPVEAYPDILGAIFAGKIAVTPFIELAPMAEVQRVLDDMAAHRLHRRAVLVRD